MLLIPGDNAVSKIIRRTGEWEPLTSARVVDVLRRGDVFVDVGAHAGYYTLLASDR